MNGNDQTEHQRNDAQATEYIRKARDIWRARALGLIEGGRLGEFFLGRKPLPDYKVAPRPSS